jgi:hypothetical protein
LAETKEKIETNKEKPDHFTQISFYINLAASAYFLFWNLVTLVALNNISIIERYKKLDVLGLIQKRGIELGFEAGTFEEALNQYYVISLVLFLPIIWSLFLLWRKRTFFFPIMILSTLMQILFMIIILGPNYFWNDSTLTDKIMWIILLANSSLYRGLLRKEVRSGRISFFDEE